MSAGAAADWIVLKFGGTSVSTLSNWRNIATVVRARRNAGARVLIVHSALSGVTDRLDKLLTAALIGTHAPAPGCVRRAPSEPRRRTRDRQLA